MTTLYWGPTGLSVCENCCIYVLRIRGTFITPQWILGVVSPNKTQTSLCGHICFPIAFYILRCMLAYTLGHVFTIFLYLFFNSTGETHTNFVGGDDPQNPLWCDESFLENMKSNTRPKKQYLFSYLTICRSGTRTCQHWDQHKSSPSLKTPNSLPHWDPHMATLGPT